jgi:hypothetical protein
MMRPVLFLSALALAGPTWAQPGASATECRIVINPAPSAWIIQGHDPFGTAVPEATFGVTFTNGSASECRFAPVFELDQPPFGLSKGNGNRINYALVNLTDSQDVTPRAGRTQRTPSQGNVVLGPNESRTFIYRLAANPDDVRDAGVFTQDVVIEAQDDRFRSVGGARIVLGVNVLPSARIGLAGAFTMNDGHAVVDLGELTTGPAPVPLQLRVRSTGRYSINVSSANAGRLRLGSTEWYVPYGLMIGGNNVTLSGTDTLAGPIESGFHRDSLPIRFTIGDVSDRRAGTYSDVILISVSAL